MVCSDVLFGYRYREEHLQQWLWWVLDHLLCSIFSEKTTHSWLMMEQPPRCCVPMGTPSRWWGCYAIYLRGSRLLTRQLCVRCAQVYSHRPIQHIRDAFVMPRYIVTKLPTPFYCSCHLFLSLMSSAIFYSINSPNSTHPNITVPEPLLDCWDYRYAVPATKKYSSTTLSQPVVFPLKRLVLSMFFSMCRCHWRLI